MLLQEKQERRQRAAQRGAPRTQERAEERQGSDASRVDARAQEQIIARLRAQADLMARSPPPGE